MFLTIYKQSRHYAGPEEGGWYATDVEVFESSLRLSVVEASEQTDRYQAWVQELDQDAEGSNRSYYLACEKEQGSHACTGSRRYE